MANLFLPSAGFTVPRSYIYQIDVALYGDTLTQSSNVLTIHAVPPDPTFAVIVINPDVYLWSSSMYQISELIDRFYYVIPPSPLETDLFFALGYWINPTTKKGGLFFNWSAGPRLPAIINLPVQPSDYWVGRPF